MIGLGTQDDGDEAIEFVTSREVYSFPVYWDETYESWAVFGVSSQPAAVLLSPAGDVLGGWQGMFPIDEVLDLASNS